MLEWLKNLHSGEGITDIIRTCGPYAIYALTGIIFAETGLLLGFFLPGDSLLITAGILANPANKNHIPALNIVHMNIILALAAIIGNQLGYFLGTRISHRIWDKKDGRFYKRRYMEEAHEFYMKHGLLAILGSRFVPIMRTFVPFAAGVAKMPAKSFLLWNIVGGIVWITGLLWAGYYLGQTPWADRLDKVIVIVVFVSVLPIFIGGTRRWMKSRSSTS